MQERHTETVRYVHMWAEYEQISTSDADVPHLLSSDCVLGILIQVPPKFLFFSLSCQICVVDMLVFVSL